MSTNNGREIAATVNLSCYGRLPLYKKIHTLPKMRGCVAKAETQNLY
jgi:hypothetical protein